MLDNRKTPPPGEPLQLEPIPFSALPDWAGDDHAAALAAFLRSCEILAGTGGPGIATAHRTLRAALGAAALRALGLPERERNGKDAARAFFENEFQPARVATAPVGGFLTGYFEPVLEGSLTRTDRFRVPVLARPPDLMTLTDDTYRAASNAGLSAMRQVENGLVPYFTRAEIESGALDGRGLELLWLADAIDAYFMHVQGSGRIRLTNGQSIRIGFAGKNGHPYTSIGGLLVTRGEVAAAEMSLERLRAWLAADLARGQALMRENRSYIFFRVHSPAESELGPIGAQGVPLLEGRSLAVDASYHPLGLPVYVVSDAIAHHGQQGFRRLMIAQDVGSAIKGPERGDIYWGSGAEAGRLAGLTRHPGQFIVLLPKAH